MSSWLREFIIATQVALSESARDPARRRTRRDCGSDSLEERHALDSCDPVPCAVARGGREIPPLHAD